MLIKNVSDLDLYNALELTNQKYDDNVQFNNFQRAGNSRYRVTLRVRDSKGPGHRLGFPNYETGKQRRLINACWHVHGTFFDKLFEIAPAAAIKTGSSIANPNRIDSSKWITIEGGNWQDVNIGTDISPYYFSEACECE